MSTPHLQPAPRAVLEGGRPNLGRFDGPIADVNIVPSGLRRMRMKEWHYVSITTPRHYVAFAIVDLGYVGNVFAYVVDRSRPETPHRIERIVPVGRGIRFSDSSISGTTEYRHRRQRISVQCSPDSTRVTLELEIDGRSLTGDFTVGRGATASLVHRFDSGTLAYTHKGAALPIQGSLQFAGESLIPEAGALGGSDWTRSIAQRQTRWRWAAFSALDDDGKPLGLNLSTDVYDDANGDSEENFLFQSGQTLLLGGVHFDIPPSPLTDAWTIASRHGDQVALTFRPLGARTDSTNLGIIKSNFIQPYGLFDGVIAGVPVSRIFGVVEDHLAVW
jgi:hypothetical protein